MPVQSSTSPQIHHTPHAKHAHKAKPGAGAKAATAPGAAAASSAGPATVVQISKEAQAALSAHDAKGDATHDGDKK